MLSVLTSQTPGSISRALAEAGKQIFTTLCSACHTQAGTGMAVMGAPDLTQPSAFIYGSSFAQLQHTIRNGRNGSMPAQLQYVGSEDKVHLLAAYVYSLSSQGEKTAAK